MGVTEHLGAILSHFDLILSHLNPILGHFRPILSHFEDVVSVWERPWAAKAFVAVKKGVKMAQWAQQKNRKANSASGAVVHMVPAMGLHAIRQFPRLLGGRAA